MEMVINAVMLLHLECANPIDSPRHGGCRANRDRRRAPGPLSPSLPAPSSLGPRAGHQESPLGLGPATGSWEPLSGSRNSRPPVLYQLSGCSAPTSPAEPSASHPRFPRSRRRSSARRAWGLRVTAPPRGTQERLSSRAGSCRRRRGLVAEGGPRVLVRVRRVWFSVSFQLLAECDPADWQSFSAVPFIPVPKSQIPCELLLFPTQE